MRDTAPSAHLKQHVHVCHLRRPAPISSAVSLTSPPDSHAPSPRRSTASSAFPMHPCRHLVPSAPLCTAPRPPRRRTTWRGRACQTCPGGACWVGPRWLACIGCAGGKGQGRISVCRQAHKSRGRIGTCTWPASRRNSTGSGRPLGAWAVMSRCQLGSGGAIRFPPSTHPWTMSTAEWKMFLSPRVSHQLESVAVQPWPRPGLTPRSAGWREAARGPP